MHTVLVEATELALEVILGIDPRAVPQGASDGVTGVLREPARAAVTGAEAAKARPTEVERWVHERLGGPTRAASDTRAAVRRATKDLAAGIHAKPGEKTVRNGVEAHPREHLLSFLRDLSGWLKWLLKLATKILDDVLGILRRFLGCVVPWAIAGLDDLVALLSELGPLCDDLRRAVILVDVLVVNLTGIFTDVYDPQTHTFDFRRINGYDYRAWLKKLGASDDVVFSAPIRFLYAGTFANLAPGTKTGSYAAGTAICGALEALAYKRSIVWMFRSGTGDTMIMPIYQVLQYHGVHFEFFRAVRNVVPCADGSASRPSSWAKQVSLREARDDGYTPWFHYFAQETDPARLPHPSALRVNRNLPRRARWRRGAWIWRAPGGRLERRGDRPAHPRRRRLPTRRCWPSPSRRSPTCAPASSPTRARARAGGP